MNRRDFLKYGTMLAGIGGICFLCGKNKFLPEEVDYLNKPPLDTRPCKRLFTYSEIHLNGRVYPCCPDFLVSKDSFEGIADYDFDKIWNGELYNDIRQKVINGDYSSCKRDVCCMYLPCNKDEIPKDYREGPKEIKICYDYECNYNCITCRDEVKINTPEEMKLYDEVYLPKIIKAAKNAEIVSLLGSGDPLFSRHSRHLIKELAKEYPELKFNIFTNGLLLTEENINELGIQNNIEWVSVSVDAAKRETYKKILRTDAFDTVMKNLELMAEWKKQGKIKYILLNFVVHLMNYREMPEFVNLTKKLDAIVLFTTYRPWESAEYHKRYDEVAVFEPSNKHYKELVKILKNPIFKDENHCMLEPRLFDIVHS